MQRIPPSVLLRMWADEEVVTTDRYCLYLTGVGKEPSQSAKETFTSAMRWKIELYLWTSPTSATVPRSEGVGVSRGRVGWEIPPFKG